MVNRDAKIIVSINTHNKCMSLTGSSFMTENSRRFCHFRNNLVKLKSHILIYSAPKVGTTHRLSVIGVSDIVAERAQFAMESHSYQNHIIDFSHTKYISKHEIIFMHLVQNVKTEPFIVKIRYSMSKCISSSSWHY